MEKEIDNILEDLDRFDEDIPQEVIEDISKLPPSQLPPDIFEESKLVWVNGELVERRIYHITEKINALSFLNASKRYHNGDMIPYYAKVSKDLGIPVQTLRRWWVDREAILKEGSDHLELAQQVKAAKLSDTFLNVLEKIDEVVSAGDFEKRDLANLGKVLSIVAQNGRLFENKSTKNVEHKHEHRGRVQLTVPDDAKKKK